MKRLKAPYKSNCTQRIEYKIRRECEDRYSKEHFNSLLFGNYYSREAKYENLSLGLNQQYFFYKYNRQALENISVECSIRTSMDQCDEFIYYIFSSVIFQIFFRIRIVHTIAKRYPLKLFFRYSKPGIANR